MMKKLVAFLLFISVAAIGLQAQDTVWHRVIPGETLGMIAEEHQVRPSDIIIWNKISYDEIVAGKSLIVGIHPLPVIQPNEMQVRESSNTKSSHYFIIAVIICVIVLIQLKYYFDTRNKIVKLKNIFPEKTDYNYIQSEDKTAGSSIGSITSRHKNTIFEEIIRSINAYLKTNQGRVSDYHLMKDVVDRNCDAAEEEIDSQVPVPLYMGLMGTMAGILVGVGYLWLSGDLKALLIVGDAQNNGIAGVNALLGGVALAMISSILGIILTTLGSMKLKDARTDMQKGKHAFLSWIQENMLPHLNNDTAKALERMTDNLTAFNSVFSGNTEQLGEALSKVNTTTQLQIQLLDKVNQIDNERVTKQNLLLYKALSNSTEEIGKLAELLHDSTEYVDAVRKLNARLDKGERRNVAIENMAIFFEAETKQIEQRKLAMTETLVEIEAKMTKTIGEIDSKMEENLRELGKHADNHLKEFYTALGKQQDALQKKLGETEGLLTELKNLQSIKESASRFERTTREQNAKIEALTAAIKKLAEMKSVGNVVEVEYDGGNKKSEKRPWKRTLETILLIILLITISVLIVANWDNVWDFILLFRF